MSSGRFDADSKLYAGGHRGMVGGAIAGELKARCFQNVIMRTHDELNLTNQAAARPFFATERRELVYLVAEKVGGIDANNSYPAEFTHQDRMIQWNLFHSDPEQVRISTRTWLRDTRRKTRCSPARSRSGGITFASSRDVHVSI